MFMGFSPESVDFLWGIRLNNNREWFLDHKQQYIDTLYQPMKALGEEVFQVFADRPGNLLKVSRIYRDARLKPDKPYKESLWLCIRQDVQWWADNPCLFLEINPEGVDYGFFQWHLKSDARQRFYQEITANPGPFLALMEKTRQDAGMPVTAQLYQRPKLPENPALAPYFRWKDQISCIRHVEVGPEMFSPALAQEVSAFFEALLPLYEFFTRFHR